MVELGTWAFGLCSQYMCVPSCRDNRKLGTCLVCLVNLKLGTLVPISSVQAVHFLGQARDIGICRHMKWHIEQVDGIEVVDEVPPGH